MVVASIIIPTYRRTDLLALAVESCLAQDFAEAFDIIVVDNNPDGSARDAVTALQASSRVPVRYIPETRAGISHARNTGVAAAQGRYLAFLDDDQRAAPGWLSGHIAALRGFAAGVSFGPTFPDFPEGAELSSVVLWRYTRDEKIPTGSAMPNRSPLLGSPGMGNSVMDRELCRLETPVFDLRYGFAGGEDTLLFRQLLQDGCRMVWCAEGCVRETIPASRLTERYLLRRAYNGGQVSASTWGALHPPARGKMATVMAAGVVQAGLFVLPALICRLTRHPRWLACAVQVAGGLGKIFCNPNTLMPLYREDRGEPAKAGSPRADNLPEHLNRSRA